MKHLILSLIIVVAFFSANCQTRFFGTVKIEFEKTYSVHASYKESNPEWYDMVKDRLPKSVISYHDYIGDSTRSLYKPGREMPIDPRSGYRGIADKNIVYSDFRTGKV